MPKVDFGIRLNKCYFEMIVYGMLKFCLVRIELGYFLGEMWRLYLWMYLLIASWRVLAEIVVVEWFGLWNMIFIISSFGLMGL